jgi:hypothetical protein
MCQLSSAKHAQKFISLDWSCDQASFDGDRQIIQAHHPYLLAAC